MMPPHDDDGDDDDHNDDGNDNNDYGDSDGKDKYLLQMFAAPSCLSRVAHSRQTARPSTFRDEKVASSGGDGGNCDRLWCFFT